MNATTAASVAGGRQNSWRAVVAASIGNALEWFDLVVYGFFAVTISKLFFRSATRPYRCCSRSARSACHSSCGRSARS